jgi:outer membrane usher protein
MLVNFTIVKTNPATVILLGPDGKLVPAGSEGRFGDRDVIVGYEGDAYVEDATPGSVIEMQVGETICHYHLPAADGTSQQPKLGPLACERSDH